VSTTGLRIRPRAGPLPRKWAIVLQIALLIAWILIWEYVPKIPGLSKVSTFLDPFFISSPTRTWGALTALLSGTSLVGSIWPFMRETLQSALIGTAIGMAVGTGLGLLLSNSERLNQVFRPFVLALNSVPRIAMIPIIVVLLGATSATAIASAAITAFFTVFFNAYAGGRQIPAQVLDNATVLGATPMQLMRSVRLPFVMAWAFASLPNAVSHGLLSTVTAEILTGYAGMGRLLVLAVGQANSHLTISVVIMLSFVGLALVLVSDLLRKRWLHWWVGGRAAA
jgi:NitT/TauT family transport system permease protein